MAEQQDASQAKAASVLQRRYRDYRSQREAAGLNLTHSNKRRKASSDAPPSDGTTALDETDGQKMRSGERWGAAMASQGLDEAADAQRKGVNDPGSRWRRTGFYAQRLTEGGTGETYKTMESKYYLELVDRQHRYASNLKYYHARWNEEDTNESFFQWLDEGGGKDLDLPECSRKQLDSEKLVYLDAEQRRNYHVIVKDGLLVWARNGRVVDTKGRHRDSGDGTGIIDIGGPEDDGTGSGPQIARRRSSSPSYSSGPPGDGAGDAKEKEHYTSKDPDVSTVQYYTSTQVVSDVMLRKTTHKNTWIYVMTGDKRLYVGIKQTGKWQHSSLAYGAQVVSAGTLKVKRGKLSQLTPLSGHYRSGTEHFENFVAELRRKGVNMHHVSVSKSLAVIGAIETYGKAKKKKTGLLQDVKDKLHIGAKSKEKAEAKVPSSGWLSVPDLTCNADSTSSSSDDSSDNEPNRLQAAQQAGPEEGSEKDQPHRTGSTEPYSDLDISQMNDKQKYDRGLALMRKAMAQGLKKEGGAA